MRMEGFRHKKLDEKSELQEKKRALMPPVDEKTKSRNWLLRFVGEL